MELFMYVCIWKRKMDKTKNNLKINRLLQKEKHFVKKYVNAYMFQLIV